MLLVTSVPRQCFLMKIAFLFADDNALGQSYCQQRLTNVNPTDTDGVEDVKNRVVTAREF